MSRLQITRRWSLALACGAVLAQFALSDTRGANITWIGLNADWTDGIANNANWNPADEPDTDDTAIFNTSNIVNLGSNNGILALTMSAGIDLNLNAFDLDVNGLVQLAGSSTNLIVGNSASLLTADSITINNLATLELDGGTVQVNEESGDGLLDINVGGRLNGNGILNMTDALAATTSIIINDGTITARATTGNVLLPPPIRTFSINATDIDARIDLDGAGEAGVVAVQRNQTLDIKVQLSDIFNGSMTMAQNTTLNISNAWILGSFATIDIDNGAAGGIPAAPAGVAIIAGASFSQNSGTINVVDTDGTLQFDAPFSMNGGSLVNNGLVVFNSSTTIAAAANFTMPTSTSSLTVATNRTVNLNAANFDMDGINTATNVITVNTDATLNINTGDYDPDSATNAFDGTVNLVSGTINVNVADVEFVMDGVLTSTASGTDQSLWTGDALAIGNDAGVLDADLNILGTQPTQFGSVVRFNSDADVDIATDATAHFLAVVNFNSVNAANNAQFTGAGEIIFSAGVNVSEATTLNLVGGTVDLDGADSIGDTINIDAPLVINAQLMRSFGKTNGGGGTNLLDINNSVNTGTLTVNLDAAADEWTLNTQGVINLVNDNTEATLLAGNDLNVNGTISVTGDVRTTARLDIAGTVNINTAGQPLRLAAGNDTNDPNTLGGGTINGVGILGADTGKALFGFGTINTQIDFDGTADLMADNGTLNIDGTKLLDVETLGTADTDGILNVTNAWNNNVTAGVQLRGGTLSGGAMTNDATAGISGHGIVTARINNNSQLFGSFENTLIFQTAANDNDWDGATNAGQIKAISGNIELRDVGAAFAFTGTVSATNAHRAYTNGFALDFNPGSTLSLGTGGTYESTSSTDIGGTVNVGVGGATIKVANNNFLTFESGSNTTLGSDLRLENNNIIIEAGAIFSGTGAVVIPDGSNLVADNLANVGVLLNVAGGLRPGNSEGIGRVNLFDFQMAPTSELFTELTGTGLNQFDRLVVSGDAVVAGFLSLDIDGGFVPTLGNTFNIITASSVTGTFDHADMSGMPAGLTFAVTYLANAVQLQVVNKPNYAADFDDDGDVDSTDLAIWTNAFNLNQLGDANGDNITDGSDWTIWRDTFGSTPLVFVNRAVPEPTSLGLIAATMFVFKRRRKQDSSTCVSNPTSSKRAAVVGVGVVSALAASASAAPSLSVINGGVNGSSNREWLVRVLPDTNLFGPGGDGSVAVELGFNIVGGGQLVSATLNSASWPNNLPGRNPFTGGNTVGLQTNLATDTVFVSAGSNLFNSGAAVQVIKIETQGSGPMTLNWGGHNFGSYTGSRISQAGQNFNSIQGTISSVGLPGDFDLDGDLDATDIDMLFAAQQGPVPPANAIYDLTGNNNVNSAPNTANSDADHWVRVLKDTEYGDANLDDKVNFDDLLVLAQHYGQPTGGWASGSFNGVAGVGFDDLLLLAQNYGFLGVASGGQTGDVSSTFQSDWQLARSMVPEPGMLSIAAAFPLIRRRR